MLKDRERHRKDRSNYLVGIELMIYYSCNHTSQNQMDRDHCRSVSPPRHGIGVFRRGLVVHKGPCGASSKGST